MKKLALPAILLCGAASQPLHAASLHSLYTFAGGKDGAQPFGTLIRDAGGNLFGTTGSGGRGNGTVFELLPPAAGKTAWTEKLLFAFHGGAGGANPDAGLVMDSAGALYGTTQWGGTGGYDGTVFKLTPPAAGQTAWSHTVIHAFGPKKGTAPVAGLVMDSAGALYGTTCGCGLGDESKGSIFKLAPPAASSAKWSFSELHAFKGDGTDGGLPHGGLTLGAGGVLYGAASAGGTHNAGVVFSLSPPAAGQAKWSEQTLYSFTGEADGAYPRDGVAFDAGGAIYTTAQYGGNANFGDGAGTLIKLAPPSTPGGAWQESTLHVFGKAGDGVQPGSTPIIGASGEIYGTTDVGGNVKACPVFEGPAGCGVIYELLPPAAGQTAWTEKRLHEFSGPDGNVPWGGLFADGTGIYGTTEIGGASVSGTVFKINQ